MPPGEGKDKAFAKLFSKSVCFFLSPVQRLVLIEQLGQGTLTNDYLSIWNSLHRSGKNSTALVREVVL